MVHEWLLWAYAKKVPQWQLHQCMCSTTRACACTIEIKNGVLFYAHATLLMLAFIYIILLYFITMIWCSGIVSNCHSNHSTEMNNIVFRYVLYVCVCFANHVGMKRVFFHLFLLELSLIFFTLRSALYSVFFYIWSKFHYSLSCLFFLFLSILFYQSLFFARRNFLLFTATASSGNTWVSH